MCRKVTTQLQITSYFDATANKPLKAYSLSGNETITTMTSSNNISSEDSIKYLIPQRFEVSSHPRSSQTQHASNFINNEKPLINS